MAGKVQAHGAESGFYPKRHRWETKWPLLSLARLATPLLAILWAQAASLSSAVASDLNPAKYSTGFEQAATGSFTEVTTELGTWKATAGQLIIDSEYAKSGRHCLRLAGPKSVVELEVAGAISPGDQLIFDAERWTAQPPFSFRIEKQTGTTWTEVFKGDEAIRVGRSFLSTLKIPLGDSDSRRLRFTVTSPANTGVLIDDVRLAKARPQELVDVQAVPATFPALVGNEACPLVKLRIETSGSLQPLHLKALEVSLRGTSDIADIESVQVISTGQSETFSHLSPAFASSLTNASDDTLSFSFAPAFCTLSEGVNYVWVAGKLKSNANIDNRVGASCQSLQFSSGQTVRLNHESTNQRMGIALRNGGDDGVDTYRIPGLATSNRGTLIAVYDIRYRNGGDLPGDIDVGMSRSIDGGRTWAPMKIVMDKGNDPAHRYDGIGDPAVLVDRVSGTIWVAALWSHGNRGWSGSGPGLTPDETGQLVLVRSDDDGITWSQPINITSQVKQSPWCLVLQGPGKGVTMRDGTLVFAAQYQDSLDNKRLPYSTIIYSSDRGETWQAGTGAFGDTTEAQVVESEPGVLMLNCRYNRASTRVVMTTTDLGKTWSKHPTSESALIEPRACMASLIDVGREISKDSGWLLFSNPDSPSQRQRITIKASPDRGLTWPKPNQVLLDEGIGAGYSCMTMIDANTVGIVYEGSQAHLTFQRIALSDLVDRPQ
jgi:sialidase-1